MRFSLPESTAVRAAGGLVVVAALVFVASVVDAFRVHDTAVQPPPDLLRAPAGLVAPPAGAPVQVDGDPFAPDGSLPARRYRLPGDAPVADEQATPEVLPEVLGTAVATEGRNFATVRLGSVGPRVLYAGDSIGAFRVKAIERGAVTFTRAPGDSLTIRTTALFIRS